MDMEKRLVIVKGRGREWMDWEFGISRCELFPWKWIRRSCCIALGSIIM